MNKKIMQKVGLLKTPLKILNLSLMIRALKMLKMVITTNILKTFDKCLLEPYKLSNLEKRGLPSQSKRRPGYTYGISFLSNLNFSSGSGKKCSPAKQIAHIILTM